MSVVDAACIDAAGLTSGAGTPGASSGTITLGFTRATVDAQGSFSSITMRLPAGPAHSVDADSQVGVSRCSHRLLTQTCADGTALPYAHDQIPTVTAVAKGESS